MSMKDTLLANVKKIIASINPGVIDISDIGDGTLTGAIDAINKRVIPINKGGTGIEAETLEELLLALGGANIKKLWTNASPTSNFAGQKIGLDLADYDGAIVIFSKEPSAVSWYESRLCLKDKRFDIGMTYYAGIMRRYVDVIDTGVTFSACSRYITFNSADSATTVNSRMIPVEIYGVKGVQ